LFDGCNPLVDTEIESVRTGVKAALPALDGLAVGLLANMAHVTLNGSTSTAFGAGVLEREVFEYLQAGVRYIAVVIGAAHITTLSRQVEAVAGFDVLGQAVVMFHSIHGRVRAVCVEAIPVFIDWNVALGLFRLARQSGGEEL
jgi:hypothetical protein